MSLSSNRKAINVIQGDFAVSDDREDVMTTVLGSCVAACIYDPRSQVGGLNHFLLPGENAGSSTSMSYGLNAMELLINNMLKQGASRKRFQAKLFGGARMIKGLSDIGQQNATFALDFLKMEGIPCVSQSLGGTSARRIRFWPTTGRVQLRMMGNVDDMLPVKVKKAVIASPDASELDLF